MTPLRESPFSRHFNILLILGAWLYETDDPKKENLYILYKLWVVWLALYGSYMLLCDFYNSIGDLKNIVWNLCVSVMFIGSLSKAFQLFSRNYTINGLRKSLHQEAESRRSPEHFSINNLALKELKLLQASFYGSAVLFIPIWLFMKYFAVDREFPIPVCLPVEFDVNDHCEYTIAFILVGVGAIFGLVFIMESELAMFCLLIQISREYKILLADIPKLNFIYEDNDRNMIEINPRLRRRKAKMMIKHLLARQKNLIEYTKIFELCYNPCFLPQFFGMSFLITTVSIQCMVGSYDIFGNLLYQLGYMFTIVVDMFLLCWFSTRLQNLCYKVGETAYSTLWYKMEVETRKDLAMLILRSQHPPKITSGKIIELSLNAFVHRVSNIYSWLALFRSLEFKNS